LRGRPIVLATRYEAMRNQVYRLYGKQGSVIFIQDEVFASLDPEEQKAFSHWDCTQETQRIRDNHLATQAWFKFVEPALGTDASLTNPPSLPINVDPANDSLAS